MCTDQAWKYRLSYTVAFGGLLYMVLHERKTDLWRRDGSADSAVMTPFLFFVVLGFITFWLVQGSDPGYLGAGEGRGKGSLPWARFADRSPTCLARPWREDVADIRSGDHLLDLSGAWRPRRLHLCLAVAAVRDPVFRSQTTKPGTIRTMRKRIRAQRWSQSRAEAPRRGQGAGSVGRREG